MGDFDGAMSDLETALRLARRDAKVPPRQIALMLCDRANLRFSRGRWVEAEKDCRAAREIDEELYSVT